MLTPTMLAWSALLSLLPIAGLVLPAVGLVAAARPRHGLYACGYTFLLVFVAGVVTFAIFAQSLIRPQS
jgi:hypothetical protein